MADREVTRERLYGEAIRAVRLGLAINLGLGATKLVGGLVGRSFALVADAVNSLGDVFTSLVVLVAFRLARKPPDEEHPYGHTRAEAIAGSNVAVLVVGSALLMGWEALRRLGQPHAPPPIWALAIAAANVAIKEALYRYKVSVGRRAGSSAVIANAWDHRADAFSALAVLVGLTCVRVGGPRWIAADEVAALVVVAAILWSAGRLLLSSVHELMDVQADPALLAAIRDTAQEVPGVMRVEKLFVRKTGLEYLVDIHIQVDAAQTVAEGHRIGHLVKSRLLERHHNLRDVLVHLEPFPHEHETRPGIV